MSDKLSFIPVCGTEDKIANTKYNEGWVYFSTDTKKIYLDINDSRLPMGGNTGIFYGNVDFGNFQGPEFEFIIETDLEGNNIPNIDDLIINTDGCFYKVIKKTLDRLVTKRIVLSGSSTGPSGEKKGDIEVEVKNGYNRTVLAGSDFTIDFLFTAYNAKGEGTGAGTYEIAVNNVVKKTGIAKNAMSQDGTVNEKMINQIPIGDLFNLAGDYEIRVFCYGFTGGSETASVSTPVINIKVTDFTVTWELSETTIHSVNEDFSTFWHISVDGENITSSIKIDDTYTINDLTDGNLIIPKNLFESHYGLTHGVHKFELSVTADIGADTVSAETITKNLIFYDEEDSSYIIVCNFFEKEIMQYDTVQIPIMIYHGTNTEDGNGYVRFKVNGVLKSTEDNMKNFEIRTFSFTPLEQGFVPISFESNNNASTTLFLNVQPLNINATETTAGCKLRFKASEFANNEEIKNWKLDDGQHLIFSDNFDWINGGLTADDNDEKDSYGSYFKIPAGSKLTIPYYLFQTDLNNTGANCKIIFKASNCRDYDAQILKCYDSLNDKGLILNAQNGIIKYAGGQLSVRYCEDTYIEYEFNIGNFTDNDSKNHKYLTVWLDGIPVMVNTLSSMNAFDQLSPQYIEIGSDDCDVCLYLIKFYNRRLTKKELLNNFIVDVPKASQIKSRYDRNQIISKDSQGNEYIDPFLLAEKNPNCNVYVYSIPYMPTSKDDVKVGENDECCTFEHYKGSKNAIRSYDKVKLRAQGTSSMEYGVSAYNLDATFPEKWSMDDTAIPVNYYNTKVNVASCEGANNALNQEWYNRFQPYKTQKRLQERNDNKIARDTMQFKNGVLFIKDNNQETTNSTATKNNVFKEINKYVTNPYPRMYSIANMGNAKKNSEVFHGAGNEYECCVEVANNNTNGQRMVTIGGFVPENKTAGIQEHEVPIILSDDLFDEDGFIIPGVDWGESYDEQTGQWRKNKDLWTDALINEGLFEFRYIIKKDKELAEKFENKFASLDEYKEELSNRFLRLVRWFAKWNPSNTYSEKDIRENLKELLYNSEKDIKLNSLKYQTMLKNLFNEQVKLNYGEIFTEDVINNLNTTVEEYILSEYKEIDITSEQYSNLFIAKLYDIIKEITLNNNLNTLTIENEVNNTVEQAVHEELIKDWREIVQNQTASEEEIKELYKTYMYNTKYKLPEPIEFTESDLTLPSITTFYPNYKREDEVLAGQTEPSLKATYELDSKEYRAARMLSEAGKYLVMDSVVYHYLFIERHTMVDNVAKNTFWNTEDGIHWELTKDYDNDTADGVDNSGFLTFDYGIEAMDNAENGSSIFNARTSSWLNFVSFLPNMREIMYQATSKAWEAEEYLQAFENWQNSIPEVCWIEDIYRKYFRPYEVYNDASYLPRLANGKKTHQRKQYEIYQQQYMDSKYKQNKKYGTNLEVRVQQPAEAKEGEYYTIKATLKTYADGYVLMESAGVLFHQRAKKGTPVEFSSTMASQFDNATFYIYSPNLYTEFTGLENLYPQYIKVSNGEKLRKISLNATKSYQQYTFNETIQSTFPKNLEELYLINCKSFSDSLELKTSNRLKILNASGSGFQGFEIASGAPLTTFIVESPQTIKLSNLFYLESDKIQINNYNYLQRIDLNNIDFNINSKISKNISKNIMLNAGIKKNNEGEPIGTIAIAYKLNNVGWDFTNGDEINLDGSIPLLDKLLSQSTIDQLSKANSLTGFGNILESSYNNSNSINIYNRYNLVTSDDRSFPNFTLDFKGNNAKLYTINIENGDGEIVWSRKVSSLSDLENTLLTNSQKGAFNATTAVLKSESNTHTYNFANAWEFKTSTDQGEVTTSNGPGDYNYLNLSLIKSKLTDFNSDITIKPKYISSIRHYRVSFFGEDQENPFYVKTDATFGQTFNDVKPIIIPSKDDSDLALEMTYEFIGYSSDPNSSSIINENAWSVTVDNIMMYAVFIEKSVYDIDYTEFLNIEGTNLKGLSMNGNSPKYTGQKLVIPKEITTIEQNSFKENQTLKYILMNKDSALTKISNNAFYKSQIEYFEFSSPLKTIGNSAFQGCKYFDQDFYKDQTIRFPNTLETIGSSVFQGCFQKNNSLQAKIYIPTSVTTLGKQSFSYWGCYTTIYIGDINDYTSLTLSSENTIASNKKTNPGTYPNDIDTIIMYTKNPLYSEGTSSKINPDSEIIIWDNTTSKKMAFFVPVVEIHYIGNKKESE